MECSSCHVGELEETLIEHWLKDAGEWVLLRNVPALQCDTCGATVFPDQTVETIEHALTEGRHRPTGHLTSPVFDLAQVERERPANEPATAAPRPRSGARRTAQ